MKFIVTDISFDCSLEVSHWTLEDQLETEEKLPLSYIGSLWEVDDEDDLIERISCASGWCISSIDYEIQLT